MNLIRKIVIVLVGVSLALLVTVLFLNPDSIVTIALSMRDTSALIRLPLAILIDALVVAVLVVLVRTPQARPSSGLTVKAQGAIADVSVESATDRILRAVRDVPDVLSAQAKVQALRGKADVDLEVVVSQQSTNLPDKQREIDRALRQVINKQLGLQLASKPRVHIHMADEQSLIKPSLPPAAAATPIEPIQPPEKPEVTPVSDAATPPITPEEQVAAPEPPAPE